MKNYIRCKKCGSCINLDTGYEYIPCACGAVAVDGGPDYCRVIGNFEDYEFIEESEDDDTCSSYV